MQKTFELMSAFYAFIVSGVSVIPSSKEKAKTSAKKETIGELGANVYILRKDYNHCNNFLNKPAHDKTYIIA